MLSVRTKLIFGFALILISTMIVGWRGIVGMRDINEDLNEIKTCQFMPSIMIADDNVADETLAGMLPEQHIAQNYYKPCRSSKINMTGESNV